MAEAGIKAGCVFSIAGRFLERRNDFDFYTDPQ